MSIGFIFAVLVVFLLLVVCEIWWRRHEVPGELSRKFIHLTVGSFVAFWPFFLSWNQIRVLSLGFVVVVFVSKQFHIFRSIHSVKRPTWGEVLFALSVGILTYLTHNHWIYAVSLLQMSLADGLAAVVGVEAKPALRYKVLGHVKSVPGSLTFLIVSLLIMVLYQAETGDLSTGDMFVIGGGATVLENFGLVGLDNILVPVFTALMLRLL